MVDFLREFVQCGGKDVDAFVFPLLAARYSDEDRILRHHTAEHFPRDTPQGFPRLGTPGVKGFAFGHIGGFEAVGRLYVHFLVEQLCALAGGDVADRGETIGGMRRLLLDRMLGNHIQLLRHLVAVIAFEIVVQRFPVSGDGTSDAGGVGGEKRCNLRAVVAKVED